MTSRVHRRSIDIGLGKITGVLRFSRGERALMRVAVMKIHAVCEVGYVTREFENDEFENWKWLVAIEVQDAVFDFERSLTAQEETAVEVFIEERLAVLTCGGLFLESSLFLENGARHAC